MTAVRHELMGMPVDAVTREGAIHRIEEAVTHGVGGAVLTPNIDILRQCCHSKVLRDAVETADLLVADGMPVVWAARLQGTPVPARITGSDMLWGATEVAARNHLELFLAGGRADVGPRAIAGLRGPYPALRACSCPCFIHPGHLDGQLDELKQALLDEAPPLVLIALPFAAQVHLIMTMRPRLPSTWFIGIGSSCDFITGDRPRAPEWLQQIGLEWAHRVVHEPRMARRYLVHGLPFATQLAAHSLAVRARGAAPLPVPGAAPALGPVRLGGTV